MRRALEVFVPLAIVATVCSGPGCSSSSSTGGTGGGTDSGTDQSVAETGGDDVGTGDTGQVGMDTGSTQETGASDSGGGDSAASTDSADAFVCAPITTLHPPMNDGGTTTLYCPFAGVDASSLGYCDPGTEHCCESSGSSSCEPTATACASGAIDWQCGDPLADCSPGQDCCGAGTFVASTDVSCGNTASGFTGTSCVAAGSCTHIVMCTSSTECPSGKTCTPLSVGGNSVGACI